MRALPFLAAALVGAGLCGNAHADYFSHYDFTLSTGKQVTNMFLLERAPDGEHRDIWSFNGDGAGTTHIDIYFPSTQPIAQSLFIGEVQGLASDVENPDQKHIVLLMADDAAGLANHIAWGTLFRNTNEDELLRHLEDATSGDDNVVDDGIIHLEDFAFGDAVTGILDNLAQPHSAWFNMGGTFSAMTFSDGEIVGSGSAYMTTVPEPPSFLLFGVGVVGFMVRRRRK